MQQYSKYYKKYMGYYKKDNKFIYSNKSLIDKINKKYNYLVIMSIIDNKEIISINKKYYKEFLDYYENNKNIDYLILLKNFFQSKNLKIDIRYMYRMSTNKEIKINNKDIIFKEDKKKCAILDKEKIISYAKISNINYNGANIVIFAEEEYRNKGYATNLLAFITNYSIKNKMIPIYLVEINNKSSLKVAKKCNYTIMNKEIIISEI